MVKIIAKKKQWQWWQRQKLSLGFTGRTKRLQNYGRPIEGNRKEHPVFSPGRRRKKVSGIKAFNLKNWYWTSNTFYVKYLHECRFFPIVIFLTPCLWSNTVPVRLSSSKVRRKSKRFKPVVSLEPIFLRICRPLVFVSDSLPFRSFWLLGMFVVLNISMSLTRLLQPL